MGLTDITRKEARIRTFGLSEAMVLAYLKDHRFVLLTCLLLGFSAWWMLLPEPLLVHPSVCCSPEYSSIIKGALSEEICPMRHLGFPCIHPGNIHERILETFTQPEVFDPLELKLETKTAAFAVMVGVVIMALTLGDSVTQNGIIC